MVLLLMLVITIELIIIHNNNNNNVHIRIPLGISNSNSSWSSLFKSEPIFYLNTLYWLIFSSSLCSLLPNFISFFLSLLQPNQCITQHIFFETKTQTKLQSFLLVFHVDFSFYLWYKTTPHFEILVENLSLFFENKKKPANHPCILFVFISTFLLLMEI